MYVPTPIGRDGFRSVFVSDVHLGCRFARAERFLNFLETQNPERLYLVGDFIDGWRLRTRWHWEDSYWKILRRLISLADQGTEIFYTPGNHDDFLRSFLGNFASVRIANEFLHETADGRRFVVLHGDRFDDVEARARWLSYLGGLAYDGIVSLNGAVNLGRKLLGMPEWQFSSSIKQRVKKAVMFVSHYEERLAAHAKSLDACGVICGHIHTPCVRHTRGVLYCNTGDWVEHCTALVEYRDGRLKLLQDLGAAPAVAPALFTLETVDVTQRSKSRPSVAPEFEETGVAVG